MQPFLFGQPAQPMTPEERRTAMISQLQQQIMGRQQGQPQTIGSGIGSVFGALGNGLASYASQFPEKPGGGRAGFGQTLSGIFGGNGGLY